LLSKPTHRKLPGSKPESQIGPILVLLGVAAAVATHAPWRDSIELNVMSVPWYLDYRPRYDINETPGQGPGVRF
jgi:hypothetical protein